MNIRILLIPILAVSTAACLARPAIAQPSSPPPKSVRITLHPMAEPRPALKYRLLPSMLDQRPGNAAVYWNRVPAEERSYFNDLYKEGGAWWKIDKWMEIPLGDPREKEMRAKEPSIGYARGLYHQMAQAARFESCDWQLPIHEGNFYDMPLPEIQQLREFGRLLAAKARLDTVEGKYDEAVDTMQTGFALARDTARGQPLVCAVVGGAIASLIATQIEQFVQQPDAPNLYWALSTLPRPLVDFRLGYETDWNFLYLQFPMLRNLEKKDLTADEWRTLLQTTVDGTVELAADEAVEGSLDRGYRGLGAAEQHAVEIGAAMQAYPRAKEYLIEHGRSVASVEAMPVAKVILLASVEAYRQLNDRLYKAMFLPYAEGQRWLIEANETLHAQRRDEIIPFASILLPPIVSAKRAETRLEWNIARLRIFEALRIYAAGHGGKLPDQLEDIAEVPIPRNPFDDKPFDYHRDGDRATLTCQHGPPAPPWTYEITMLPGGEKR